MTKRIKEGLRLLNRLDGYHEGSASLAERLGYDLDLIADAIAYSLSGKDDD